MDLAISSSWVVVREFANVNLLHHAPPCGPLCCVLCTVYMQMYCVQDHVQVHVCFERTDWASEMQHATYDMEMQRERQEKG